MELRRGTESRLPHCSNLLAGRYPLARPHPHALQMPILRKDRAAVRQRVAQNDDISQQVPLCEHNLTSGTGDHRSPFSRGIVVAQVAAITLARGRIAPTFSETLAIAPGARDWEEERRGPFDFAFGSTSRQNRTVISNSDPLTTGVTDAVKTSSPARGALRPGDPIA